MSDCLALTRSVVLNVQRHFLLSQIGGCSWHLVSRSQGPLQHSVVPRQLPPQKTKMYQTQNVNSDEAEKLLAKGKKKKRKSLIVCWKSPTKLEGILKRKIKLPLSWQGNQGSDLSAWGAAAGQHRGRTRTHALRCPCKTGSGYSAIK